jgi:glutathione S-transferase
VVTRVIRLFDFLPSGNGYKVRLLLRQLGIPFELVERDITKGETRTPEFLAKNPNGRIPLVELDDGRLLWESGAILLYYAEGTRFLPADRFDRAQIAQWMFFEQYSHEPYVAVARAWLHVFGMDEERKRQLPQKQKLGNDALSVMERHLATRAFFVAERYTIADIALYAYTHVAEEGGFDLDRYPAVCAWLERVRSQPRHIAITQR